jgi:hypothetical protein
MIRSLRLAAAMCFMLAGTASVSRAQSVAPPASVQPLGGPAFGIDMNSMATELAPGLQVLVPVCRLVAIDARPMLLGANTDLDVGGRLEVQLRSPVYLDRVRVYFAAGPQGFTEVRGNELHQRDFSGGWDTGVEVFLDPHFAVHWEMGTSGGGVIAAAGPAFSVGFRSYPWPRR